MSKKKRIPKIVPFFENSPDGVHCLQACIKSILSFYFPERVFLDKEIDEKTGHVGGFSSWLPPAAAWLHDLGLDVRLFSPVEYERLCREGEGYMKVLKGDMFNIEKQRGEYDNMPFIQASVKELLEKNLIERTALSKHLLRCELENERALAILKTVHGWLDGNAADATSHYVLAMKEYSPGTWRVHDAGPPPVEGRIISQEIRGENIYGDVLLIKGKL